jgi:hypothetical protein
VPVKACTDLITHPLVLLTGFLPPPSLVDRYIDIRQLTSSSPAWRDSTALSGIGEVLLSLLGGFLLASSLCASLFYIAVPAKHIENLQFYCKLQPFSDRSCDELRIAP